MAVDPALMHIHYSGVTINNGVQGDPNASLGNKRASNRPYEQRSVSTINANSLTDGSAADSDVGRWLLFVTGSNALEARRCSARSGTTLFWDEPLPVSAAEAVVIRLSAGADLFNDGPTTTECSTGIVDHRAVYLRNDNAEQLLNIRAWLQPLTPGPIGIQIAVGDRFVGTPESIPAIATDTDEPDIRTSTLFTTNPQGFFSSRSFATAAWTPSPGIGITGVNPSQFFQVACWIKRTIPPQTRKGEEQAWLLVFEAENGASTAGPHLSGFVFASNPDGFVPDLSVAFDRVPRTFGGARVQGELLDQDSQLPVIGVPMEFSVASGPGSVAAPSPADDTDDDGRAEVQYTGPDDEGQAGASVQVEAKIGGDP